MTSTADEVRNGTSYTKTMLIQAAPERLYQAVSTAEGIRGWWSDKTTQQGNLITVDFWTDLTQTLELEELDPGKHATWHWLTQHFVVEGTDQTDEWVGTRVVFEIEPTGDGGSKLVLTHQGLTPQLVCFDSCSVGWDGALESLRAYLEQGAGTPYVEAA